MNMTMNNAESAYFSQQMQNLEKEFLARKLQIEKEMYNKIKNIYTVNIGYTSL
jgi:predicted metalloendopeptidase